MTDQTRPARRGSREGLDDLFAQIDDALSGYETQRAADFSYAPGDTIPAEAIEWNDDRTEYDETTIEVTAEVRYPGLGELVNAIYTDVPIRTPTLQGDPVTLSFHVVEDQGAQTFAAITVTSADGSSISTQVADFEIEVTHYGVDAADLASDDPNETARNARVQAIAIQANPLPGGAEVGHWHVTQVQDIQVDKGDEVTVITGKVIADRCTRPTITPQLMASVQAFVDQFRQAWNTTLVPLAEHVRGQLADGEVRTFRVAPDGTFTEEDLPDAS